MTSLERFHASMSFKPFDRPILWEHGPWSATIRRWQQEGMEGDYAPEAGECDPREMIPVKFHVLPTLQRQVLSEDEDSVTYIDEMGITKRERKEAELSMPFFLKHPVGGRDDWENIKRRLDPTTPERYPDNWGEKLVEWSSREWPIYIYGRRQSGFFGPVREYVGAEEILYLLHDDPALVEEMMEYLCEFFIETMRRALAEAPLDYAIFWEDMAYKTGPLISPQMFRKYMLSHYRRVAAFVRAQGIEVIMVDSDGNINELIPLFLEAGVNCLFPMEVQSGMDVVALRKEYGKDLLMHGGIDKRCLARDRKAIDAELERVIPVALEGGYVPTIDHSIPPDVPYDNFRYYWDRKKELLGIDA